MRIGFLFNHSAAHQVAHSLPIAAAMADTFPQVDLQLLVAQGPAEAEVRRLWEAAGHPGDDARIVRLAPASAVARTLARASGDALPTERLSILQRNLHRFRDLDALVVPEKTSTLLKTLFGLPGLRLVHTRHGAGDRAIGFDRASARFDLVLLSGPKIRDRLQAAGLLKEDGHAIVGYAKFDAVAATPRKPIFDNGKPTVLYNPHPAPALSSWYRMGPQVVDWFARQDRFNLVLAPHVMLFARRWTAALSPFSIARVPAVPASAGASAQVLVDLGSRASVDMTYTDAADIYLGDASSQVYEFLRRPRPCIFLDAHRTSWRGNPDFAHWQAGEVVGSPEELPAALDRAMEDPAHYAQAQRHLFDYSFDLDATPSAVRAAEAIVAWLGRRGVA